MRADLPALVQAVARQRPTVGLITAPAEERAHKKTARNRNRLVPQSGGA